MDNNLSLTDAADLSEPFIDDGFKELLKIFFGQAMPTIAGDIPLAKLVLVIGKMFNSGRNAYRTAHLTAFLNAFRENKKNIEDFNKLSEKDQGYLRGLIISQIDMQTDLRQSEAIACIVGAYLEKRIDWPTLTGVVSEIKNTSPLLYHFSEGGIKIDNPWGSRRDVRIIGPGGLPAAFGNNSGATIGEDDTPTEYRYSLTALGHAFFDYVYLPMSKKYGAGDEVKIRA